MEEYRKILIPVDGSDLSKIAFEKALSLAKVFGSSVTLLHVNERVLASWLISGEESIELSEQQIEQQFEDSAEQLIEEYREISKERGIEAKSSVVTGNPANEIIESSKDYDLIVMGTHGRGGLYHLLIGGTAEKVVRHACCPVFLIRNRTKHRRE